MAVPLSVGERVRLGDPLGVCVAVAGHAIKYSTLPAAMCTAWVRGCRATAVVPVGAVKAASAVPSGATWRIMLFS